MTDITKCKGDRCPRKNLCKRFNLQPESFSQSWFVETPGYYKISAKPKDKPVRAWRCDYFMPPYENT
jgi:hypothetical protein